MPPPNDPKTGRFVSPDQSAAAHQVQLAELSQAYDIEDPGQPKATPPAAPPPAPAAERESPPPVPKLSKHVLRRAKALGFDEIDLEGLDPDVLEDRLFYRQQDREQLFQQQRPAEAATPALTVAATTPAPAAPVAPAAPASFKDSLKAKYGGELNATFLDALDGALADILEAKIDARLKPHLDRLESLDGTVKAVKGWVQNKEDQSFAEQAEAFFAQHPEIYGEGSYRSMDKDSAGAKRRGFAVSQLKDGQHIKADLGKLHSLLYGTKAPPPAAAAPGLPNGVPRNGDATQILADRKAEWERGQVAAPSRQHTMEEVGTKAAAVAEIDRVLKNAQRRDGDPNTRQQEEDSLLP